MQRIPRPLQNNLLSDPEGQAASDCPRGPAAASDAYQQPQACDGPAAGAEAGPRTSAPVPATCSGVAGNSSSAAAGSGTQIAGWPALGMVRPPSGRLVASALGVDVSRLTLHGNVVEYPEHRSFKIQLPVTLPSGVTIDSPRELCIPQFDKANTRGKHQYNEKASFKDDATALLKQLLQSRRALEFGGNGAILARTLESVGTMTPACGQHSRGTVCTWRGT